MAHLKYTLEIKCDGKKIRTAAEPVRMREIPQELSRLVRSGLHDWDITISGSAGVRGLLWGRPKEGFVVTYETLPAYLQNALAYTWRYLTCDVLYYLHRETLEKLYSLCLEAGKLENVFRLRSSGSEMGYIRKCDEGVPHAERLNYGTAVKVRRRWTRNYSYVDTWEPKYPGWTLTLCMNLESVGWDNVKKAI